MNYQCQIHASIHPKLCSCQHIRYHTLMNTNYFLIIFLLYACCILRSMKRRDTLINSYHKHSNALKRLKQKSHDDREAKLSLPTHQNVETIWCVGSESFASLSS